MPQLSIVVPTFRERDNVGELVSRLHAVLDRVVDWEVVFVDDDSPDGTAEAVRAMAQADPRVRVLHRFGRRGLSSACAEGILATSSPVCAVMDADLQHDERVLPRMLEVLREKAADVVVGSRYVAGGSTGTWEGARRTGSVYATKLAAMAVKTELTDPMSGFFMLRREVLHEALPRMSNVGFKILLDILASVPHPLRVEEVPYTFRTRHAGESKLDTLVAWEYLVLLADKMFGGVVPVRFLLFSVIGAVGILTHMAVLVTLFRGLGVTFAWSQAAATLVAMTGNYLLNNLLTYRDRRLRGWGLLWGWVTFTLACGIGAVANVGVASYIFSWRQVAWVPAALAGILISSVWNYAVSAIFTWNAPRAA
jgi:dolichol-phosphate mannosyltransferase